MTGSVGSVGITGLTLGGGYGPLIGRFGLALDNLLAAEVVLADGRIVTAMPGREEELFWALRGGGGNFGVATEMHIQLHHLSSVRSGMLIYPFAEAKAVLERYADVVNSAPDGLTAQVGFVAGAPVVLVVPTWCGSPVDGEAQVAPFLKLGTLLAGAVETRSYAASLTAFDSYIVNGQPVFMQTYSVPALDSISIDAFIQAMQTAVSPGCAISPMSSKARPRGYRRKRQPSACVAIMCWSRSSQHFPIGATTSSGSAIGSGREELFGRLMQWRFLGDIPTSLARVSPTAH